MTCPVVYEDKNNNFKRQEKFFFLKDHSKAVMKLISKGNFKNFNLFKIDRLFWVASVCFRPHFDYTGSYSKNCLNVKWESDVVSA